MKWPLALAKTVQFWKSNSDHWRDRAAKSYEEGWQEAAKQYREWMVDANYNLYHSADNILRSRVYAALTEGAHTFKPSQFKEKE